MTNEEYHGLFGICLVKTIVDVDKCITCGVDISGDLQQQKKHSNEDEDDLDFLDPLDREFMVMLDWCLGKGLEVYFNKPRKSGKTYCLLILTGKEYTGKGATKALALRDAIEKYTGGSDEK